MGIVLRSSYTLHDHLLSGRLVRLQPDYCTGTLAVFLAYPSRKLLSAKVHAFVDFMTARFPHPEQDPWLSSL